MLITAMLASFVAPALAAVDLTPSITAPSGVYVYGSGRYTVTVSNVGSTTSGSATLTIQLPVTHTSPSVYVMGTVGAKSSSCVASGTKLTCSLGTIRGRKSTSVYFDISMPESTDPLVITTTTSVTGDSNAANNVATSTAALNNYVVSFAGGLDVSNSHCTGTNLTSYYECTLFSGTTTTHDATLNGDGSVSIPAEPDYSGTWSQPTSDSLVFTYTYLGSIVAEFEGYGVPGGCFEGITTFPSSTYVSPYKVCPL